MSVTKFEFLTSIAIIWMFATVLTEIYVLEQLGFSVQDYYEKQCEKKQYSSSGGLIRIIFVMYWLIHVFPLVVFKLWKA